MKTFLMWVFIYIPAIIAYLLNIAYYFDIL